MPKQVYTSEYLNKATESRFYFADRNVNDPITLPYDFTDIKIKPNELVTTYSINGAFGKIYDNLLYIMSQSKVAQSILPRKYQFDTVLTTTSDLSAIEHRSADDITTIKSTTRTKELKDVTCGFIANHQQSLTSFDCLFFTNQNNTTNAVVMCRDNDETGVEFLSKTTDLDNFTNRELLSANKALPHEDVVYVLNTVNSVVYKYDMTGLLLADRAYFDPDTRSSGKLLIDFIGGYGRVTDNMRFNNPVTISVNKSTGDLFVIDHGASSTQIKQFDSNSNFLKKYDITTTLNGETPVDLVFTNRRFYLLTDVSIQEYSSDFILLNTWSQDDNNLAADEHYKQIVLSAEDTNVLYVSTNKNVLKKFISKLSGNIGTFTLTGRNFGIDEEMDIGFISCVESTGGEYVYVCDKNTGMIYKFNESMDYQTCLANTYEHSFIPFNEVEIKPDEFVNHIVYNKSLTKLFYNHAVLGNNLIGKFLARWISPYIKKYQFTRYALPEELWSRGRLAGLNNMVGVNELLISSVINRTLGQLYEFQINILKDLRVQMTNARPVDELKDITPDIPSEDKYEYKDGSWSKQ